MNSDCTHWQGSIAAYVDGELPADARQAFRLHAQSCAACAMQALAAAEAKLAIRSAGQRYSAPTCACAGAQSIGSKAASASKLRMTGSVVAVHAIGAAAPIAS